jgi:regulation of enolase protein 1 (concanavalin A-like superfamily)
MFRQYEDWVHQALTKYEGANSPKKTFITEFGWQTTNSSNANGVSAALQDTNLIVAFSAIRATPYVQMAIWFNWEDNPAGSLWYGVLDSSGSQKVSYHDFQQAERFEGIYSNGTTNAGIQTYFNHLGQSILGNPLDNGQGPWVYIFLNGYAQDYFGGSHSNLLIMATTNGTFELNNLYGFWGYYQTNNGAVNFGAATDNAYASGGGLRQDFSMGYFTWDSTNQVVWHSNLPSAPDGVAAAPGNGQVTLQWTAVQTATAYKVYTSTNGGAAYSLNSTVVGPPNFTDAPLNNGVTYFYEVTALTSYGEGPASAPVNATPEAVLGNLPVPWQDADLGSVNLAGSAGYTAAGGQFTVRGSGADIGGTADAFHFVYQPFNGDITVVARVKSQAASDAWSKAGIMIRESLATNAIFAMTALIPSNGVQMEYRTNTSVGTAAIVGPAAAAPYWMKLARTGSNFTASVSADGISFVQVGTASLPMKTNELLGLAVCSHNTNLLNAAVFDNVTLTQVAPLLSRGANGVLSWSGGYTLQEATNVSGAYQDMTNAVSPFTITNAGAPQLFFRLRY